MSRTAPHFILRSYRSSVYQLDPGRDIALPKHLAHSCFTADCNMDLRDNESRNYAPLNLYAIRPADTMILFS